jgi:hypothetical protein
MRGLFKTLWRPDHEGDPLQTVVADAANVLQVGEFQFLQLAYFDWHGEEMPESLLDVVFRRYMLAGHIPHWARNYARQVLDLSTKGAVNDNDPFFHRYDHDYSTHTPNGVRRFITASLIIIALFSSCLALSVLTAKEGTTILPPYFDRSELPPTRP